MQILDSLSGVSLQDVCADGLFAAVENFSSLWKQTFYGLWLIKADLIHQLWHSTNVLIIIIRSTRLPGSSSSNVVVHGSLLNLVIKWWRSSECVTVPKICFVLVLVVPSE